MKWGADEQESDGYVDRDRWVLGMKVFSSTSSSNAISTFGGEPSFRSFSTLVKITALRFFDVTFCALGHKPFLLRSHRSHRGPTGRQITWKVKTIQQLMWAANATRTCPKPTSMQLISQYNSLGSHDCRFSLRRYVTVSQRRRRPLECTNLVCSGVLVGGLCQPRRLVILWT